MPALRTKALLLSSEFKSLLAEQMLMLCTEQDLILVFTLHFQAYTVLEVKKRKKKEYAKDNERKKMYKQRYDKTAPQEEDLIT